MGLHGMGTTKFCRAFCFTFIFNDTSIGTDFTYANSLMRDGWPGGKVLRWPLNEGKVYYYHHGCIITAAGKE
jgi:hypothetical protein